MVHQAPPELIRARQLWVQEKFDQSVALFDRAVSLYPDNFHVLIDAARIHGQYFNHPRMEKLITQLTESHSNDAQLHLQVGMTYRMAYRPHSAIKHLKKSVRLHANNPMAYLELAIIYERLGRLPEANTALKRCFKYSPNLPESLAVQARVLTRQKRIKEAARLLKKIISLPEDAVDVNTCAYAAADYAKLLEQQGDLELAINVLKRSKKRLEPHAAPLMKGAVNETGNRVSDFFSAITHQHIQDWRNATTTDEPQTSVCLMTSFPRSGTTLLESMLGSHPQIVASDEMDVFHKQMLNPMTEATSTGSLTQAPDAFSSLDEKMLSRLRNRFLESHENVLGESLRGKVLLDKNPSNTVFIPFHLRLFPNLKIIVPLRDPRDVILSCYFQHLPLNPFSVKLLDLKTATERFVHDMTRWIELREHLDHDQWREIKYENLTVNPKLEIRQVLEFLDLPWHEDTLDFTSKGAKAILNAPTYADVQGGIYQGAKQRWKKYESYFTPLREQLEPTMNALGYEW